MVPARALLLTLATCGLWLPAAHGAGAPVPPLLASGRSVERQLAAGESHRWRARACAGCYLRVVAEQRGCDLVLELSPPGGEGGVAVDSPSGRHGREWALVPGGGAGPWTVEVRSAPTGGAGTYRLEVVETHPGPGARPGPEIEAELAWTEAAAAYLAGDGVARERAVRRLEEILPELRRGDDPRRTAEVLVLAAELSAGAGGARAPELLAEAAALFRAAGDGFGEAQALTASAFLSWRGGRVDEALRGYRRALDLYRGLEDPYGAAQVLNNLGHANLYRGEPRTARPLFLEARDAAREVAAPHLEAAALNNLGGVHEVLGELPDALRDYGQARELYGDLGRRRDEARALVNLGAAHRALGDYVAALESYLEARALFVAAGDAAGEATVLNSIGSAYLAVGEPERARRHLLQALPLRRDAGDRRGEAATLHNLARAAHSLGESDTARDLFHRALELRRELEDPRGEATTLDHLGSLELARGDVGAALDALRRALELRRSVGDPHREARALRQLGQAEAAAGRPEAALELLGAALELLRQAPAPELEEVAVRHALARIQRTLGRPGEAAGHLERALAILESRFPSLPDPDLEASFLSGHRDLYELAVAVAMERHRADPGAGHHLRALELAERGRSRGLLALLGEAEVEIHRGVEPVLLERRRVLSGRLAGKAAAVRRLRGRGERSEQLAALEAEIADLLVELEATEGEIRRQSPRYAELTRPAAPTVGDLQELLGPETLLLEYSLAEERSFLWAVTAEAVTVHELPPRRRVEELVRRLHELWSRLDAGVTGQDAVARELSQTLLGPVARRLDVGLLAVVPDGALHYLPFAALPGPEGAVEALLVRRAVVHLPSARVLAALRDRARGAPPDGLLAVLAAPSFPQEPADGLPALPWSRREAEAIAALSPPEGTLLALGEEASRGLATGGRLRGYRFVHFATHGVLNDRHPALSGLALSAPGGGSGGSPGFLGLRDLYNLDLRAELVVLSGCRTALGREVRGEGLVGLSRGFLAAGASAVVASLWPVQDRPTAELMVSFYRSMLEAGLRPAAALRAAQVEVRSRLRWRDPYFWAGFVLVGDWE